MDNKLYLIKNKKKRITFRIDDLILLAVMFGVFALNRTSAVANREYTWLAIIVITLIRSLFHILKNRKAYFGVYFIVQSIFMLIVFLSRYWAVHKGLAIGGFNSLLLTTVIIFAVINIVDSKKNMKSFIWAISWAGVFMLVFFFIKYGFFNIVNIRYLSQIGIIKDINANGLGMKIVISALGFIVYGELEKQKKRIYSFISILMVVFSIFTGSRKVFLMLGFCFSLVFLLKNKQNRILRLLFISFVAVISAYLIMQVPMFYDVIGIRIDELLSFLVKDNTDPYSSTGIRLSMINIGIQYFRDRPFWGYGIANAEVFNGGTYLHNNYLELLVGVGLIGTIVYYINLFISLHRNKKLFKSESDIIALLFLLIVLNLVFMDVAFVSYNARVFQIVIAVSVRYYDICEIKKKKIIDVN